MKTAQLGLMIALMLGIGLACDLPFGGIAPTTQAFNPTSDTRLSSGTYTFSSVNVPAATTVTVLGDVVINVTGNTNIAGTLSGDCFAIEIRGKGDLTLDGLIRNTCANPPDTIPGIKLVVDGEITIGSTISDVDAIVSAGAVFIADSVTENESLKPLAHVKSPVRAGLAVYRPVQLLELHGVQRTGIELQGKGQGMTVKKPVRAGRGSNTVMVKNGPFSLNASLGDNIGNKGKDANAKEIEDKCDNSDNWGGNGGSIYIAARDNALTIGNGVRLRAGDGGKGGSCTAFDGCPADAKGGKGGNGGGVYFGGQTISLGTGIAIIRGNGGPGGDARALGKKGAACANGCNAIAEAGQGGDAGGIGYIITVPGTINGVPEVKGADGGLGGFAGAKGGMGGDCDKCPAGAGGNGGDATAKGGRGGNGASGTLRNWPIAPASHMAGSGGDAIAMGGLGGQGANCCKPPQKGGDGGSGGKATATAGEPGAKGIGGGGDFGKTDGKGGDGWNGGEGLPPGKGGPKGIGEGNPKDIPDGNPGNPGRVCPIPATPTITRTPTPEKKKPTLNVSSPVKIGSNVVIKGENLTPGAATKMILDPSGKTVYNIAIQIFDDGLLSATFYIAGPAGRWWVVVRFAGGEVRVPFDVVN